MPQFVGNMKIKALNEYICKIERYDKSGAARPIANTLPTITKKPTAHFTHLVFPSHKIPSQKTQRVKFTPLKRKTKKSK